jgi:hypothetical protein
VYENRALRKIMWSMKDEIIGERRRLHGEELYDLLSSLNIIRVIKSRRIRGAVHSARTGDGRGAYMVLVGRPE